MKVLILSGSFHSASKSLLIARHVQQYLASHTCDIPRLDALPFYSEDLAASKPDTVLALLAAVQKSDAIICITPEYNHSIPAVLKNALDWASRPAFKSPLKDKPVTLITQAESPVGGARAQAHLKLVFDATLSVVYPAHEMMITPVSRIVTAENGITDEATTRRLSRHLDGFLAFVQARETSPT